mmetsp:Transcript_14187/g.21444  ORF Transcript_14187/g.21444 Transcript_14187/m.21444 type:complete len:262 (+) Transcript_14187:165-950(+)
MMKAEEPTDRMTDDRITRTTAKPSKLTVIHGTKKYLLKNIHNDMTVAFLKQRIQSETHIPPKLQQILYKGTKMEEADKTLAEFGIKKKAKLTLIGCTTAEMTQTILKGSSITKPVYKRNKKENVEEKEPLANDVSRQLPHSKIISQGVPPDVEEGREGTKQPLPPTIRGIIDKEGEAVRLTFKKKAQQLWVSSASSTIKYTISDIRDIKEHPIVDKPGYSIIGLQFGNAEDEPEWFYWVPQQYTTALRYSLLGNQDFPFLQ